MNLQKLNEEKRHILADDGNILVVANPGTGKTLLLAYRYAQLIEQGVDPKKILCLTYTTKARKEMHDRILKVMEEQEISVDRTELNVHTFHSYSSENLDSEQIVSSNLLRFAVYQYVKENQVFNYSDSYIIDTLIPAIESKISYLKSYGIKPKNIDLEAIQQHFPDDYDHEELKLFSKYFKEIFTHYENIKAGAGRDYADLLIDFKAKQEQAFDYVLVDELQDLNRIESEIAIASAKQFFTVGDRKQAIFGFQGGSIQNFSLFADAKKYVLSENFRSTQQILDYAADQYKLRTANEQNREELENLRSDSGASGPNPIVIEAEPATIAATAASLVKEKTAIIARTNGQLTKIAEQLQARGIDFSTTYFSSSQSAKDQAVQFIKGVLSDDPSLIRNALFTSFSPVPLREAFKISKDATKEELLKLAPSLKAIRDEVQNLESVTRLFTKYILPSAVPFGKDFFYGAVSVQRAVQEALIDIENPSAEEFFAYLNASGIIEGETVSEKEVVLSTVHKAKGREFDRVIYVPSRTSGTIKFIDYTVESILCANELNAEEELEEEDIRIDFVAFTRAKKELFIISKKASNYESALTTNEVVESREEESFTQIRAKKAFVQFLARDYEGAKAELEDTGGWIIDHLTDTLRAIDHISYSTLNTNPYNFLIWNVLNIRESSPALNMGSDVHQIAEDLLNGKEVSVGQEQEPFVNNIKELIAQIKKTYPEVESVEEYFRVSLKELLNIETDLEFSGKIDAVFKNGDQHLIVDWKTDANDKGGSKHRRQLSVYKAAYCLKHNIAPDNVAVAIGFVGLRGRINDGNIAFALDQKQPTASTLRTVQKHADLVLSWLGDAQKLLQAIKEKPLDDMLYKSIIEEISTKQA